MFNTGAVVLLVLCTSVRLLMDYVDLYERP